MIGFSILNKENKKEATEIIKPEIAEEKPVRSVVTVHFINGREYPYYNDMFELKVDDIVYVINTYDVSFFACTQDIEYDVNITPSEDEDHWLLLFNVDIPALKILDEQPIILKLYPSNLLYPSLTLYPTETEIISENENKFFGTKSTKLFNNTYLADFFDMYINEQADIQSKTSLTRIGLQSIAEWIQDFVDEYNL